MKNQFMKSIDRARARVHELNRVRGVLNRRAKEEEALALTNIELFLDTLQTRTGLDVHKKENLPTVLLYVGQYLADQERAREVLDDAAARPCDADGFPTERGDW